jgi:hypothetical protein
MKQLLAVPAAYAPGSRAAIERVYLALLTWSFAICSLVRVVTYLPAMAAIVDSGDSHQHSLWTWSMWFCSNLTMAAWLWEHNGRRANKAAWVSACNALMCAVTTVVVVAYRF